MDSTPLTNPSTSATARFLHRKLSLDSLQTSSHQNAFLWDQRSESQEASLVDTNKASNTDEDETQPVYYSSDIDSQSDEDGDGITMHKFEKDFLRIIDSVDYTGEINFNLLPDLDAARWSTMLNELSRLGRSCVARRLVDLPRDNIKFQTYHKLLRTLLEAAPDLPTWVNRSVRETILHVAIRAKHESLVYFFLTWAPEETKKALRTRSGYNLSCLDVALGSRISTELFEKLISVAGGTALNSQGVKGNTLLHTAVDIRYYRKDQSRIVKKILAVSVKSLSKENDDGLVPLQHLMQSLSDYEKGWEELKQWKLNESDKIKSILILECFRLMQDQKTTTRLLYGGQTDKNLAISVDLRGYQAIRYDSLQSFFHFLVFEWCLQSVMLPDLDVLVLDSQKSKLNGSHDSAKLLLESRGRTDYWWIFNWLRRVPTNSSQQGVRKILKVSVDDNQEHPHSDETIEHSLRGFEVDTLEWRRADICATTIIAAVPEVRQLHMFCSGRNAVLKAWAGLGGLVELSRLQSLVVSIDSRFESTSRVEKYTEEFKADFEKNRDIWLRSQVGRLGGRVDVKCNILAPNTLMSTRKEKDPVNSETRDDGQGDNMQAWVECMSRYRDFLRNFDTSKDKAIKVALIDDGIDALYADLSPYIEDGCSWSTGPDGTPNQFYSSSTGHGTIMATFIRRLCPNVKFYVARLNEKRTTTGEISITADSAVNAINWAVSRDVDIISMSWTINKTDENKAAIGRMKTAIKEAVAKRILIFCSVSDTGSLNEGLYPAECDRESIFVIGTATRSGKPSEYNGDRRVNYILPGVGLRVSTGDDLFDRTLGADLVRDGSSLATALAAGLAGVILYSVRLDDEKEVEMMKNHLMMKRAFDEINSREKGENDHGFIRVWDLFDSIRLDRGSNQEKLKNIVDKLLFPRRR